MHYPSEFSTKAKNRIEAEKIRAYEEFADAKRSARWDSDVEALLRQCVLRVFLEFAREACAFGKRDIGSWSIDRIDRQCLEFLRRLTIQVWHEIGFGDVTSRYTGSIEHPRIGLLGLRPSGRNIRTYCLQWRRIKLAPQAPEQSQGRSGMWRPLGRSRKSWPGWRRRTGQTTSSIFAMLWMSKKCHCPELGIGKA